MTAVRPNPCASCPYRRDVPSGVWSSVEYAKLREYDAPTGSQPFNAFACHASPELLCSGWVNVHQNRGHAYELLALRMNPAGFVVPTDVPLWGSGNEAADHGERDIDTPSAEAHKTMDRLLGTYPRLRNGEEE